MEAFDKYMKEKGYKILADAKKLNDEDSKNDPEEEPYKSKYAARELYQNVKNDLSVFMNEDADDDDSTTEIRNVRTAISLRLAINFEETEESSTCEELLQKCLKETEKKKMKNETVNLYQTVLNQLAIVCSSRRGPDEAVKTMKYLQEAESIYKAFKQQEGDSPVAWSEWLEEKTWEDDELLRNRAANFENTYTLTLYYAAQVYTQMNERSKAARYCHVTLQRQLNSMKYDPVDWALNAASLSQYYLSENLSLARHCLAAASLIFKEAPNDSDCGNDKDIYLQRKADIERCWIKYGLQLLESSKFYLTEELENLDLESKAQDVFGRGNEEEATDGDKTEDDFDIENISEKHLRFNLELTLYEEKITDKPLLVFNDARKVFLVIQEWIQSAKGYYKMDGHCSDYIQLVQDHSTAYKHLLFFEMDIDRQCKMHKKRIDMLLDIINVINPQHYLLVRRQLIYEVAETYSCMADLKLTKLESDPGSRSAHVVNKINQLTLHSIEQFQSYLDSLKGENPELPEKLGENDVRPALVAKFYIGRLYSKLILPTVEERLANMRKSLNNYKFVVDYCKCNECDKDKVPSEYDICVEMVELLPLKMEKIRSLSGL
ncbi:hypothetical protein SNE40_009099 [Patella caerulea]|uniref:KIF-binding protein n=1 Tax=Patella caerulea TaxID=87958 RepID=A0AAN8PPP1_PATCE